MDGPEKRPHVVTGNTPNKPTEKRPCEQEVEREEISGPLEHLKPQL